MTVGFSRDAKDVGEQLLRASGGGEGCGVSLGETVPLWGLSTSPRLYPGTTAEPPRPGNELKKFGEAEVLLTDADRLAGINSGDWGVTFLEVIGEPIPILENDWLKLFVHSGVLVFCRFCTIYTNIKRH